MFNEKSNRRVETIFREISRKAWSQTLKKKDFFDLRYSRTSIKSSTKNWDAKKISRYEFYPTEIKWKLSRMPKNYKIGTSSKPTRGKKLDLSHEEEDGNRSASHKKETQSSKEYPRYPEIKKEMLKSFKSRTPKPELTVVPKVKSPKERLNDETRIPDEPKQYSPKIKQLESDSLGHTRTNSRSLGSIKRKCPKNFSINYKNYSIERAKDSSRIFDFNIKGLKSFFKQKSAYKKIVFKKSPINKMFPDIPHIEYY